jgi:hypothetical protein
MAVAPQAAPSTGQRRIQWRREFDIDKLLLDGLEDPSDTNKGINDRCAET